MAKKLKRIYVTESKTFSWFRMIKRQKTRGEKMKDSLAMLLKTNGEKMSVYSLLAMFMKTN
jgi:hypothetical protein